MEPIDELAQKRRERQLPSARGASLYEELMQGYPTPLLKELGPPLLQTMWEHVGEAIAWARSAEDAIETGDYTCLACGKDVGLDEHSFACIGFKLRAARRALEKAKDDLEAKYPEALG